jgi:hypothetical protein
MSGLLALCAAVLMLMSSLSRAELISTEQVLQAQSGRERVKALLERPNVARKLEGLGVAPRDAQARIDALSDQEVLWLAARIDAIPAGGALSTQEWLLIIIIILLVALIA